MAIRVMTSKEDYEANPDGVEVVHTYPGHETGKIEHSVLCPHFDSNRVSSVRGNSNEPSASSEMRPEGLYEDCVKEWNFKSQSQCSGPTRPLYMRTSHVGLVVDIGEKNGYDDSDFYAVVWNDEAGKSESIGYGTTRAWTYPNSARVDATPEVLAKFSAYQAAQEKARCKAAQLAYVAKEAKRNADAKRLEAMQDKVRDTIAELRGKEVTVKTKTKSVQGTLFWIGLSGSGKSIRCGVRDAAGEVTWTTLNSVKAVA